MEDQNINCKNCNFEIEDEYAFCPNCGQQTKEDLTVSVLFYNTISNYFSFDARFLRSFVPLMFKPGYVARQFVEGRRLRYLHPAQYYLFVSVIFFFMLSFKVREYSNKADKALQKGFEMEKNDEFNLNINPMDSTEIKNFSEALKENQKITGINAEEMAKIDSLVSATTTIPLEVDDSIFGLDSKGLDSLIATGANEKEQLKFIGLKEDAGFFKQTFYKQMLKFYKNKGVGIVQAFFDTVPIAMFILLPLFALILKLFFWRRGRFAHHLVFSFYYFSFLFIVLGLILGINYLIEIPDWIDFLVLLSTFFYLWLSLKNFYQQGYFITFIKAGFTSFMYTMFILPTALALIVLGSFLFY